MDISVLKTINTERNLRRRIKGLEEEVGIYKDLCTAYRVGDSMLADEALTRLEALQGARK